MAEQIDWADRWLGGFCTVGVLGGLPVRGPDYAAHPPLEQMVTLPSPPTHPVGDAQAARAAWSDALGGANIVLLASVARARMLLLSALGVQPGDPVGLPANATRDLAEAIKHHPATPRWLDLAADLSLITPDIRLSEVRVVWAQPLGGIGAQTPLNSQALLVDASDTLPALGEPLPHDPAAATIYGLHLHNDPKRSGALIICADPTLALEIEALCGPQDLLNPAAALAQLQRLAEPGGLAARQQANLTAVREGLIAAAGLPLVETFPGGLGQHLAVRVPEPCDAATFYAYVLGEQTPIRWLPAQRPLHYAAIRREGAPDAALSAERLSRVLLVPVGPGYTAEEVKHAVLGITKAADYLGVRWATNPERAAWYAQQMVDWYGPDHDAYRVLFTGA